LVWLSGSVAGVLVLMLVGFPVIRNRTAARRCAFRFTTVGNRDQALGANPIIIRSLHPHYMRAVDEMVASVLDEIRPEPHGERQAADPLDSGANWQALRQAGDSFETIKVYLGWPPEGSDDVSGLALIYES
jgi:hypothetical protein